MKKFYFMLSLLLTAAAEAQNPLLLKEVVTNTGANKINEIVPVKSGVTFFNTIANDPLDYSDLWGLWRTDGTAAGTQKLNLIDTPGYISKKATMLTPLGNNKIIFAGDNVETYGEIWVSDGTQAGTFVIQNFSSGPNTVAVQGIVSLGNTVLYGAVSSDHHLRLYKTKGLAYGDTTVVHDFGSTTGSNQLAVFKTINGIAYFDFYDVEGDGLDHIWRSDGTAAGTYLVKTLAPPQTNGLASYFMPAGKYFYFITSDPNGMSLWKSDGSEAGTHPLKQISTSYTNDNIYPVSAAIDSILYFSANDLVHGKELWKTDGTVIGTQMVADIVSGSAGSDPASLVVMNNVLYFSTNTPVFGTELYKYDKSSNIPPELVKDIFPGNASSNVSDIAVTKNSIVFAAQSTTSDGTELWVSGGADSNTVEIANINTLANEGSTPRLMTSGDTVYFAASEDVNKDGIVNESSIYAYMSPDKIWTGYHSSDASDSANWFPSGKPTTSDNVIITPFPKNAISNLFLFVNNLYNNGTINVGNGLAFINGDFYNAGTVDNSSDGVFAMVSNGSSNIRSLGGTGTYLGKLTLSSGVNLRLNTNFKVNIFRVEGADSVYLGPYDFTIDGFEIHSPTIITDSTGKLIMPVSNSAVVFPVAADTHSYTPVTISNSGAADYFSVNVHNGVYSGGYASSGHVITQEAVNKTWFIDEAVPGSSNANITLQWNASDELTAFNRNNVYLSHYTGSTWDLGNATTATGNNPYTVTRTGITSFSPFAIASSDILLPLRLTDFSAALNNSNAVLSWHTSSELNTAYFNVQRSSDGTNFTSLGKVNARGNSDQQQSYGYLDINVTGLKQSKLYYRLQQFDKDGKFTYSKIISLPVYQNNNVQFSFSPNPVKTNLHVNLNTQENKNIIILITDVSGRQVYSEKVNAGIYNHDINVSKLHSGMYVIEIISSDGISKSKFIKE